MQLSLFTPWVNCQNDTVHWHSCHCRSVQPQSHLIALGYFFRCTFHFLLCFRIKHFLVLILFFSTALLQVAAEYSKLELLAVVSEELQKRRVVGKLHSTCSNPVMDDRKAPPSMSSERPREDAGTDEEKQRQALLARLFLQAIPPASPANISSPTPNTLAQDPIVSSGRGAQIAADGEEVNRATHVHEDDAENVDELLQVRSVVFKCNTN